jgi:hypothetical protein
MIPRHQDYVFNIPTIAAGATLEGFPLRLDPDAPFVLRGRALRVPYSAEHLQAGLQWLNMRFTDANGSYRQEQPVPQTLVGAYFGQQGNPIPEWPNLTYPASGVIWVDLVNTGANAITNLQLFFRGVKLYPQGVMPGYTYPQRFAGLPFVYPVTVAALGVTETRNNLIFTVKPDADFVFRAGQAGRTLAPLTWEVFITLKDWTGKAYSNAPIHADVFFGRTNTPSAYPVGLTSVHPITGALSPGLAYPEIYLPLKQQLYYDISRSDAAYQGALPVDYPFELIGQKVFPQ